MDVTNIDYYRIAQAILVRALHEAEFGPGEVPARRWLTCQPNKFRDLIVDGVTNLHQDWIDKFVKGLD
jgi:hypothetical protein